jgi:AraC family transcriptional regulator of adaptative response/methylated-DNA-[protein]-cysteine methyltransferase
MLPDRISFRIVESPIGDLVLGASRRGCCLVEFADRYGLEKIKAQIQVRHKLEMIERDSPLLDSVAEELRDYFSGSLHSFSTPVDLRGTRFEQAVWQELLAIPYGQTRTYGDIAKSVRNPLAFQAVGGANGRNPLAIVVPCHRVVQKGGGMSGYGGGIWRKKYLLDFERNVGP